MNSAYNTNALDNFGCTKFIVRHADTKKCLSEAKKIVIQESGFGRRDKRSDSGLRIAESRCPNPAVLRLVIASPFVAAQDKLREASLTLDCRVAGASPKKEHYPWSKDVGAVPRTAQQARSGIGPYVLKRLLLPSITPDMAEVSGTQ